VIEKMFAFPSVLHFSTVLAMFCDWVLNLCFMELKVRSSKPGKSTIPLGMEGLTNIL